MSEKFTELLGLGRWQFVHTGLNLVSSRKNHKCSIQNLGMGHELQNFWNLVDLPCSWKKLIRCPAGNMFVQFFYWSLISQFWGMSMWKPECYCCWADPDCFSVCIIFSWLIDLCTKLMWHQRQNYAKSKVNWYQRHPMVFGIVSVLGVAASAMKRQDCKWIMQHFSNRWGVVREVWLAIAVNCKCSDKFVKQLNGPTTHQSWNPSNFWILCAFFIDYHQGSVHMMNHSVCAKTVQWHCSACPRRTLFLARREKELHAVAAGGDGKGDPNILWLRSQIILALGNLRNNKAWQMLGN